MTDYVLGPDEDQTEVARRLIAAAKDPASVMWSPRPNNHPHGGVFVLADEEADDIIASVAKARQEQTDRIEAALKAAEERDAKADETGLTPEQLGFSADLIVEGTPVEGETPETPEEEAQDAADEAVVDDPNTPQDEHVEAQDRVAKRRAARKAAPASADEQKSE